MKPRMKLFVVVRLVILTSACLLLSGCFILGDHSCLWF